MKKIDIYILKKFLGSFFYIMSLVMAVTVVIDISEKVDNFIRAGSSFLEIVDYYTAFIPYMAATLGPFFVLVSVIFFTSKLAYKSEVISILGSGVSYYRFLYPYVLGAFIIFTLQFVGNHYLVPKADKKRLAYEDVVIHKSRTRYSHDIHRQLKPGVFVYLERFSGRDSTGTKFSYEEFVDGELKYKLRANRIKWLPEEKTWQLESYVERTYKEEYEVVKNGKVKKMKVDIPPKEFIRRNSVKEEMTTPELNEYIAEIKVSGADKIGYLLIEKYQRTSAAFSIFILSIMGAGIASRKVRGGRGWHLVLGIALSALYEIVTKFSITFTLNADLPAIVSVWIPNLIFAIATIYIVKTTPK
ncbi:MAG: YjgP/YjgQ family permease [Chitinophagales bacterium]|nr:YjgP/YjgQ family permease [Chitinophagales bacterium]